METLTSIPYGSDSISYRVFNKVAGAVISNKFKRLIYISSLIGVFSEIDNPDKELVEKLNNLLRLANTSNSIASNMKVHSIIWGENFSKNKLDINGQVVNIGEVFKKERSMYDYRCIAEKIADLSPEWLRYGSRAQMSRDVITMIDEIIDHKDELRQFA